MNKKNSAVKAASVKSIIAKINKAYQTFKIIKDTKSYAENHDKLYKSYKAFDALVDELKSIGNDVKFDYYKGEYFAKFDADGNEVFVTYVKNEFVCRDCRSAKTAGLAVDAAREAYLNNDLEQVDELTDTRFEVI